MLQDGFSDRRAAKTWGKFAIFAMLFTENDYNAIYKELSDGNIQVLKDRSVKTVEELPVDIVEINYIK